MPHKAAKPIPEGLYSLTPQLWFGGNCREAIDFYKKAFNAVQVGDVETTPDGKVIHALLKFGSSPVFLADSMGGSDRVKPPEHYVTMGLYFYVGDVDALFTQATAAGCEATMSLQDAFWGDRTGQIKDPYGYLWDIATHTIELTPDEMKKAQEEWMEQQHGVMA